MIVLRFEELLREKERQEGRRITIKEVAKETGISRQTLTRLSDPRGHVTNTAVLDRLCKYFRCQPGELLEYIEG
ncbi:MAG: helix-turn-helix transcriptional regulator [Bacillota bacterium]